MEALEPRRLLSTYTVTNLNDSGPGSLRDFVQQANAHPAPDLITFAPGLSGVITLTLGGLVVTDPLTIDGPGAEVVAVSGYYESRAPSELDRLTIENASDQGIVNDAGSELTLVDCVVTNSDGINNHGTLTVVNSTVSNNADGIGNYGGKLFLLSSSISNNRGVGVGNNGTVVVDNCTISGNETGIAASSDVTISDSTISGNDVGISNLGDGDGAPSLTVVRCTISSNRHYGILNSEFAIAIIGDSSVWGNNTAVLNYGTLKVWNTTIAQNARHDENSGDYGTETLVNDTISGIDNSGDITASNCIITTVAGNPLNAASSHNLVGGDSKLAILGDYGGPTLTMPPLAGSPAIDEGAYALAVDAYGNPLLTDQRGLYRYSYNGAAVDIGAVEGAVSISLPTSLVVDTLADEYDANFSAGHLSLREAVAIANYRPGKDVITFAPGLSGTVRLTLGQLSITDDLAIDGPGPANLAVSGNDRSGVFVIETAGVVTAQIDGLSITGGGPNGLGGGIYNNGSLSIGNCTISENAAYGGGGICNNGSLSISDCGIYGNTALKGGGGIYNAGTLTIAGSTISGNSGANEGAGILNSGTMSIDECTISGNDARDESYPGGAFGPIFHPGAGGGIYNNGTLTITRSTVSRNTSTEGAGIDNNTGNYNFGYDDDGAVLVLSDSTVADNLGDGIFFSGDKFSPGVASLVRSSILGNSGAGIVNFGATLGGTNVTICGNAGGGISGYGALTLTNSTICNNRAAPGNGAGLSMSTGDMAILRNTIIAGNFQGNTTTASDVLGALDPTQSRSNLLGAGGSGGLVNGVNGNIVGVADPKLAPLGNYGGPTQTMPPLPGSPAIDAGDTTLATDGSGTPLAIDQRGQPRVLGQRVDIGAVEGTVALLQLQGSNLYLRKDQDGLNVDLWLDSPQPGTGVPTAKLPLSGLVAAVALTGTPGDDTLTLDFSNGKPVPTLAGLSFDGGAGNNTLRIIGTPGDDSVDAGLGGITITAGALGVLPVAVANVQAIRFPGTSGGNDTLDISAGNYNVDATTPLAAGNANVSLVVGSGATAKFTTDQRLAGLTVNGLLDVGASKVWTTTPAATIRGYLNSGYGINQDWSGTTGGFGSPVAGKITSSLAAGNPTKYTIGYADGNDQSAQDAGIAVSPGQVLVQPTLVGDANLDGQVNFFDLPQLLGYGYNAGPPASYTDGDLNYDGVVDFLDLSTLLSANYNTGHTFGAPAPAAMPAAAPLSAEAVTPASPPRAGSAVRGTPFSRVAIPVVTAGTPGGTPVLPDWPAAKKRRQIFADA
jgi:hypothetical protein